MGTGQSRARPGGERPEAAPGQGRPGGRGSGAAAPGAASPAGAAGAPRPAIGPVISPWWGNILAWVYLSGEPGVTLRVEPGLTRTYLLGQSLFWLKAISLLCLVGWVVSWLVTGIKERVVPYNSWFHYVVLAAVIMTPLTVMLRVLESVGKIPPIRLGSLSLTAIAALVCVLLYTIWIEVTLWRSIVRLGRPMNSSPFLVGAIWQQRWVGGIGLFIEQQGYLIYIPGPKTALVPNDEAKVRAIIASLSTARGLLYGADGQDIHGIRGGPANPGSGPARAGEIDGGGCIRSPG